MTMNTPPKATTGSSNSNPPLSEAAARLEAEVQRRLARIPAADKVRPEEPESTPTQLFDRMLADLRASQRTVEEVAAYDWEHEVLPRLRACGLPGRYHYQVAGWPPALRQAWEKRTGMKLEGWHPKQKAVFNRCRELFTGKGAIVALVGPRGTGKTTIAAQLLIERAANTAAMPWDRTGPYRKLSDLIAQYKTLYADHGSVDAERLISSRSAWAQAKVHVIDELHECEDLRLKNRLLTDLLDRCYGARTDVLLISNQSRSDFSTTTSDSILSRISEHGEVIGCDWESFRAKAEARRRK